MKNKHSSTSTPLESLQGAIERVTFHSEESGFCVLRAHVKGHRDLVTVIGSAASIAAGESIQCQGVWHNDKKHGVQFKAQHLKVIPPNTLEGIEKYLGSGMIKGVGAHFAKKLVQAYGDKVFDVIEHEPERLTALAGIGKKRKDMVVAAWGEQKSIRDIMVFLQTHGVGTVRAVRIFKTYGNDAIETVRANPYRLSLDIRGIGFKTADDLAVKLGIARDSVMRAQAGARHVLHELCDRGHCAAEYDKLVRATCELLGIDESIIKNGIQDEIVAENLVPDTINGASVIYPAALYFAEIAVTRHLQRLNVGDAPWGELDVLSAIPWVEEKTELALSDSQKQAVATVFKNKVSIITGGPGVGKTTLVNSLLKIMRAKRLSVALCAPTGRAAKRLTETTGLTAKTIHRLLEFDPSKYGFKHNEENPLAVDVLVVDEASMLDVYLTHQLLKAVPDHAALLFVGDVDQLPSVGSGAVLADMINSGAIATIKLTEIFRQAASSKIIINAHRINQGEFPLENDPDDSDSDFFVIYEDDAEAIHDKLIPLVTQRLPRHYGCDPVRDIQVLTPMNRGGLGTQSLNKVLQEALNGQSEPKVSRFGWTFAPGDKVIQQVNNYNKEVYNGDIGRILRVDLKESVLHIEYDKRVVQYDFNELDEISLAYAISIHKSQGSEYPIVVMPLSTQHYNLLAKNLLYTGVTRGKRLVIIVAQKKAMSMALRNNEAALRLTKLDVRLGGND